MHLAFDHVRGRTLRDSRRGKGFDLVRRVDAAKFGGVGDRNRRGLGVVLAADEARKRLLDDLRRDLPLDAMEADDLRPAREHFRAVAFIDSRMRFGMGQHGTV